MSVNVNGHKTFFILITVRLNTISKGYCSQSHTFLLKFTSVEVSPFPSLSCSQEMEVLGAPLLYRYRGPRQLLSLFFWLDDSSPAPSEHSLIRIYLTVAPKFLGLLGLRLDVNYSRILPNYLLECQWFK